jgi:hypothetical protein
MLKYSIFILFIFNVNNINAINCTSLINYNKCVTRKTTDCFWCENINYGDECKELPNDWCELDPKNYGCYDFNVYNNNCNIKYYINIIGWFLIIFVVLSFPLFIYTFMLYDIENCNYKYYYIIILTLINIISAEISIYHDFIYDWDFSIKEDPFICISLFIILTINYLFTNIYYIQLAKKHNYDILLFGIVNILALVLFLGNTKMWIGPWISWINLSFESGLLHLLKYKRKNWIITISFVLLTLITVLYYIKYDMALIMSGVWSSLYIMSNYYIISKHLINEEINYYKFIFYKILTFCFIIAIPYNNIFQLILEVMSNISLYSFIKLLEKVLNQNPRDNLGDPF